MEMVPAARRMAVLADAHTVSSSNMRSLQEAASARGVELVIRTVERPERIGPEIEEAKRDGVEALNVLASPLLYTRRLDIFERAEALRIPTIYQSPEFAEEGGLIGYGPYLTQMFRQLARQLAKVLRGEKVSDLPVEQEGFRTPAHHGRCRTLRGRRPKTCNGRNRGMHARWACRRLSYGDLRSAGATSVAVRGGKRTDWRE